MTVQLSVPTSSDLAESYHSLGLWDEVGLRNGLERTAEREPDRLAVIDNTGARTYRQLREDVELAVGSVVAQGLEPGDAVLLVAPNSYHSVVAFCAILRASGVVVALDRRCGLADVAQAIEATAPHVSIAPASLIAPLGLDQLDVPALGLESLSSGSNRIDRWDEPNKAAARIVLFTSGTTSRPKGVVHSLHSFLAGVRNLGAAFGGFGADDAPFLSSPLASITGLSQVQLALSGGHLVLEDDFDARRSLELLERYGATLLGGAPVILEMLFTEYKRQDRPTSSLRTVALGGTMIPRFVLEVAIDQFGIRPARVYGSSEAPTHTASRPTDPAELAMANDGAPLSGSEISIGSSGHPSELLVRGPNLFQGYLSSEHNEGAFDAGWFRTGDLATISGGRLSIEGRLKEVVARKGLKISLPEIDAAVSGYPGATEWAAFGIPDDVTGERLVLAIRSDEAEPATYESIRDFLLGRGLARGKLPEQIEVWTTPLPRTASGKLKREELATKPDPRRRVHVAPHLRSADVSSA
jgi:acyl-CoA synthetase (AMP-forming)/AMP-acid ligase II